MDRILIRRRTAYALIRETYAQFYFLFRGLNNIAADNNYTETLMVKGIFRILDEVFRASNLRNYVSIRRKVHQNVNNELEEMEGDQINRILKRCYQIANAYNLRIKNEIKENMEVDDLYEARRRPAEQNNQKNDMEEFTDIIRSLVGTPYKLGGKTLSGIDCSGIITYALNKMEYNVPATASAAMASGTTDWITVTQGNTIEQSTPGVLNFYNWGNETKGQIVDATEGNWMVDRTGRDGQMLISGSGQVNQTFTPYSTKTAPISQGRINFEILNLNYK